MNRLKGVVGGLLVALVALTAVGPAAGAVRIKRVDLGGYPFMRVTVLMSRENPAPTLLENGNPAPNLTRFRLHSRSVVLAIDRSRSMDVSSLSNAVAAARQFVSNKSPADRIALYGFGSEALQLSQFATDTIDADSALRAMSLDSGRGTALYDTVVLSALALASKPRPRVLVLLTDGRDSGDGATLEEAIDAAQRVDAAVYTIGINSPKLAPKDLRTLSRATGGTYYPADRAVQFLNSAYSRIAAELRRTWILEYYTAKRPGAVVRLTAKAGRLGTSDIRVKIPTTKAGTASNASWVGKLRRHWWGAALIGLLAGIFAVMAIRLAFTKPRKVWLQERLEPFRGDQLVAQPQAPRFGALSPLFAATERRLESVGLWRKLARVLERSAVPLTTAHVFYLSIGAALVLSLIAAVAGSSPFVIIILFLLGAATPYVILSIKASRRLRAFEAQLPAALNTIAGSLKAGHSFRQAMQTIVEEGGPPIDAEFRRVLTEARLGRPIEIALAEMGQRVGSTELDFALRAVVVQQQVGGSLAGLFELVAETLTQRQQFRQKVRALTAQGRMTAMILIGLPFFIALMLAAVSPGYLDPLFNTGTGQVLIVLGLVMMAIGSVFLRRITSFRGYR